MEIDLTAEKVPQEEFSGHNLIAQLAADRPMKPHCFGSGALARSGAWCTCRGIDPVVGADAPQQFLAPAESVASLTTRGRLLD